MINFFNRSDYDIQDDEDALIEADELFERNQELLNLIMDQDRNLKARAMRTAL